MGDFGQQLVSALAGLRPAAQSLTRDPDSAQDLLQSTALRALECQHQFRGGNFPGWLYTLMRSQFITGRRKAGQRKRYSERAIIVTVLEPPQEIQIQLGEALRAQLAGGLSPKESRAIQLAGLGHSYREIAQIERVTGNTVKSRLWHGRNKLALALAEGQGTGATVR